MFGGVSNSYAVWGLGFLRLVVSNSYVCGLVFLRLGFKVVTFGSHFSYIWGLGILTFRG